MQLTRHNGNLDHLWLSVESGVDVATRRQRLGELHKSLLVGKEGSILFSSDLTALGLEVTQEVAGESDRVSEEAFIEAMWTMGAESCSERIFNDAVDGVAGLWRAMQRSEYMHRGKGTEELQNEAIFPGSLPNSRQR